MLALGQHDADYVDAYYGPPEWKKEAEAGKVPLDELASTRARADRCGRVGDGSIGEMERLRHHYLERQLSALAARVRMLKGERLSFDEESRALYDAVAPTLPESHFQEILDRAREAVPRARSAGRAVRRVPPHVRDPAREARRGLPGGDQGVPRADSRRT